VNNVVDPLRKRFRARVDRARLLATGTLRAGPRTGGA